MYTFIKKTSVLDSLLSSNFPVTHTENAYAYALQLVKTTPLIPTSALRAMAEQPPSACQAEMI